MRATGTKLEAAPAFPELPLVLWLSPAFPIGAFAYSHGLEWAQEAGDIIDANSLQSWLQDIPST
jgi:urease accessory protein